MTEAGTPKAGRAHIRILVAVVLVVLTIAVPVVLYRTIIALRQQEADRVETLLYRTDHQQLLTACREIIERRGQYRRASQEKGWGDIDVADPAIPKLIRQFRPAYIEVDNEHVVIAFGAGFTAHGIVAYVEGVDRKLQYQLVPGLWYYEQEPFPGVNYPADYRH